MTTFFVIFSMFLAMIILMAVGVIFHRQPITGSCGGLGGVGIEKACDCDKPCDKRIAANKKSELIEKTIHLKS